MERNCGSTAMRGAWRSMRSIRMQAGAILFALVMSLGMLLPSSASAAVTQLTAWANKYDAVSGAVSVASQSVATSGTGQRLYLVAVSAEYGTAAAITVSATLNGVTVTELASTKATSARQHMWLGYIKDANIPAAAGNLVVNVSGTTTFVQVETATYDGVIQDATTFNASHAVYTAAVNPVSTAAVAYLNGGAVVLAAATGTGGATLTAASSPLFTNNLFYNSPTTASFGFLGANKTTTTGGGSVATGTTVTFTGGASARSAMVIAALNPAPVGGTTTLATGTEPGNSTLAPGAAATNLDAFTLQGSVADTVTAATVTLSANSFNNIALVELTNASGTVTYGSAANPLSTTVNFTGMTLPVTTSAVTFYVRITPKIAALMPAVPGASYATTGTVTSITCTANTPSGTDGTSATLTIDNASPAAPTLFSGTAGNAQVSLTWTNPGADFSQVVIIRKGSAITEVPVEGTNYSAPTSIGGAGATVVYAGPLAAFNDSPLTNGVGVYYKIFAKDAYGNYSSTGMAAGPYTPTGPVVTVGNGTNPGNLFLKPGDALNSLDAFTVAISVGTDTITSVSLALTAGSSTGIEQITITNAAATVTYGTLNNPANDTPTVTLTTNITATTSATTYLVRIKPKLHVNMPAPPGSLYTVSGTVSGLGTANTVSLGDSGSAIIEIDNASTDVATWGVITPGNTQIDLSWGNPLDGDLDGANPVVVLRKIGSAVTEVPVEGVGYTVGATIGGATVRYLGTPAPEGFVDTGLTNFTNYYYAIFAKDTNGNYSLGSSTGPHQPWIPVCVPGIPTLTVNPGTRNAIPTDTAKYTISVTNNDNALCTATDFTLSLLDSNNVDFVTPSVLSATILNIAPGATKQSTLTVTVNGLATLGNNNVTTINVSAPAHTAPAAVTATTTAANPLMHNSKTTGSTKWGASGWGVTGGKYGTFNCYICHEETTVGANGTPNVKKVRQTITMPADASGADNWPGGGKTTATLTFADTRAGSSQYADANSAHATSSRVCEVCHTYQGGGEPNNSGVRNHAYNMSGATAGEQSHNALGDCLTCHPHEGGFKAQGCTACHGNPLTIPANLSISPATGSTTIGAHPKHQTEAFGCDYCHGTGAAGAGGGALHAGGAIYIEFTGFGQLEANDGTYKGHSEVTNGYLGNDLGVVDGTRSCATTYCHGGTIYPALPAPTWTGTAACGSCHNDTAADTGWLGSHADHLSATGANLDCSVCHGAGYSAGTTKPAGHLNGQVKIDLGAYGSYSKVANGGSVPTVGLPTATAYGNCTVTCHSTTATPSWGTDFGAYPAKCTKCHNDGTAGTALINAVPTATKNIHVTHVNANTAYVVNSCADCHGTNAQNGTHANHYTDGAYPNGNATFANKITAGNYSTVNKNCTNSCHVATTNSLWVAAPPVLACIDCHVSGTYIASSALPASGLHSMSAAGVQKHDATISGGCAACHVTEDTTNHINGTFVADSLTNNDRWVTKANMTYTQITPTVGRSGSCSGTGLVGCHSDNGNWARLWSTEANTADTTTTVGNAKCNVCHGQWSSLAGSAGWATGTTHALNSTRGSGHEPATPGCDACHVYASGAARHDTASHAIDMNSNGSAYARNGAVYGTSKAGCTTCHTGAGSVYDFPISFYGASTVSGTAIPMPACSSCHDNVAKVATVPQVKIGTTAGYSSTHVDADGAGATYTIDTAGATAKCEDCHAGHWANGQVTAVNDVGISTIYGRTVVAGGNDTGTLIPTMNWQYASHDSNIRLGGTATAGYAKSTEAEMCWACHDARSVSEWGANNNTDTGSIAYNYGQLYTDASTVPGTTTSNWTTGYWRSGKGLNSTLTTNPYWYKRGKVRSTHSANYDGTTVASGSDGTNWKAGLSATATAGYLTTAYNKRETLDAVANIRCTYCHDVHGTHNGVNGDNSSTTANSGPYLRGTWLGNPYNEDGAPRWGMSTWTQQGASATAATTDYGMVPRASSNPANTGLSTASLVGGWWIDQNNNNPVAAHATTAFRTATGNAGLCQQCHGGATKNGTWDAAQIGAIDQITGEGLWVSGYNGHGNSVIGGTGAGTGAEGIGRNIFNRFKRGSATLTTANSNKQTVDMGLATEGTGAGYSYRNGTGYAWLPRIGSTTTTGTGSGRYAFRYFAWNNVAFNAGTQNSSNFTGTADLTISTAATEAYATDLGQSNYHTFSCSKCHNPHASRLPKLMITNCLDTNHNTWEDNSLYTGTAVSAPWAGKRHSNWATSQNCHRLDSNATNATSSTTNGVGWNKATPWMEDSTPQGTKTADSTTQVEY